MLLPDFNALIKFFFPYFGIQFLHFYRTFLMEGTTF